MSCPIDMLQFLFHCHHSSKFVWWILSKQNSPHNREEVELFAKCRSKLPLKELVIPIFEMGFNLISNSIDCRHLFVWNGIDCDWRKRLPAFLHVVLTRFSHHTDSAVCSNGVFEFKCTKDKQRKRWTKSGLHRHFIVVIVCNACMSLCWLLRDMNRLVQFKMIYQRVWSTINDKKR